MEKMKLTENMVLVLKVLADREGGAGFAREVLEDERLKGKTFNSVNATLAAAAGKGLATKEPAMLGEKLLTRYTITDLGREVVAPADEAPAEDE